MTEVLLLTATVRPNTTVNVSLSDPRERLRQYREALDYWVEVATRRGGRLRVVETSGCSEDELFANLDASSRRDVDLISFTPRADQIERGKGFLEWCAIAEGLTGLQAEDTVYKVTGRLRVPNSDNVFGLLPDETVRIRMRIDGNLADTRIVGARASVWRGRLLPAAEDVRLDAGIDIEQAVGANLIRLRNLGLVELSAFPQRPFFVGVSGFNGARSIAWRTAVKNGLLRPVEPLISKAARALGH